MKARAFKFAIQALREYKPVRSGLKFREDNNSLTVIDSPSANPLLRKRIVINYTATEIFLLCDGCHTIGEIIAAMSRNYPGIKPSRIAFEVLLTIRTLQASGAIMRKFT